MQVFSVDVGYGFVKAAANESSGRIRRISFPSAILQDRSRGDIDRFFGGRGLPHRITAVRDGVKERWLAGEAALVGGGRRYWNTLASERIGYDALVLTALALLGAGEGVSVALGLPLGVFTRKGERQALADSVTGISGSVSVDDGVSKSISVAQASVYPQGVGALIHQYSLRQNGLLGQPVGVVDVGYKTVDYLLVMPGANGLPVPDTTRSGSIMMGMGQAVDAVRDYIRDIMGVSALPPEGNVHAAIQGNGTLPVRGKSIEVREVYEEACRSLALSVASEIERVWREQMDFLAAIYLTGGGGRDLARFLDIEGVQVMDNAVHANALGFLSLASAVQNRN